MAGEQAQTKDTPAELEETLVTLEQCLSQQEDTVGQQLAFYNLHEFCRNTGVGILASELQESRVKAQPLRLNLDLSSHPVLKAFDTKGFS